MAEPPVGPSGPNLGPGLAVSDGERAWWVSGELLADAAVMAAMGELLGVAGPGVVTHDAKPLLRALQRLGVDEVALIMDTALASYLLDPADTTYDLGVLLERYAHRMLPAVGPPDGQLDLTGEVADPSAEAAHRAAAISALHDPLSSALEAQGLGPLNDDIEIPLVAVLARMEELGVGVDVVELIHAHHLL